MLPDLVKGEWPPKDKLAHSKVNYEHPSRHEDEHCSLCEYYIPAMISRCKHVSDPIRGNDWCKRFEARE